MLQVIPEQFEDVAPPASVLATGPRLPGIVALDSESQTVTTWLCNSFTQVLLELMLDIIFETID